MTSSRQRNDADKTRRKPFRKPPGGKREGPRGRAPEDAGEWVWGWHAVAAALANPRREAPKRLLVTADRAKAVVEKFGHIAAIEIHDGPAISQAVPASAVHQGIALKIAPLEPMDLEEMATPAKGVILMLDSVTDPQNVGAILRSAAAFGARGVILQDRHAPPLSGALAKAAAGAVDALPHARVVNLSRALETLADLGWRAVGLDGTAPDSLAQVLDARPTVVVLGSEGDGIRRLVAEHCDALASIPMPGGFESLNVSAAAAVALYEASRPVR
ncbi:23S rRNA (guanosine(2251)-2'-O)-methyltransferase RlmB [soil metagenome]